MTKQYICNLYNIVHQLYFNQKKKKIPPSCSLHLVQAPQYPRWARLHQTRTICLNFLSHKTRDQASLSTQRPFSLTQVGSWNSWDLGVPRVARSMVAEPQG